jgi:hypothetical protein
MEKETLEEIAQEYFENNIFCDGITEFEHSIAIRSYIAGAKLQAERMYSEEEVYELLLKHQSAYRSAVRNTSPLDWSFDVKQWFEQFKKK